jgi:hypothetical protein
MTLFVFEDDEIRGPVMELFVQALEEAREELLAHDCAVIRRRDKGQDWDARVLPGVIRIHEV